jgi:uncharacterized protein DUF3857/transglutaminase superfamily protein
MPVRFALLIFLLTSSSLAFADKTEDWLPITDQDRQINEVPGTPGASAIQLYYADRINASLGTEFVYQRIKILNDSGKKYADVEVILSSHSELANLKARTIHPDGSIVDFTGKPLQKTVFKGHGFKFNAKSFTFPEVTIGSIVEYKYKLNYYWSDTWLLQHDLFTVREYFSFEPRHYGESVSWFGRNMTGVSPTYEKGIYELEWHNVPAFHSEPDMPPERNYKGIVQFYYVDRDIKTPDKFWNELAKELNHYYEESIGNRNEVRQAARDAIGNENDPEKKLRKLYDRAQQLRNLSYERTLNDRERKKENIKENKNVGDVLKRGYGDSEDITELFVALARAAGFDASVLLVSNRSEEFFSNKILSLSSLPGRMARVNVGGKDVYLQPGIPFCPYGLQYWPYTSTEALQFNKNGGSFVMIPGINYDQSITRRVAKMEMADDGSLKGELTVEFRGEEGLQHRLDARDMDDAGRKKDLEEEIQASLPSGSKVELSASEGWTTPYQPLVARFKVEIPVYASKAGKRLLVPSLLFQSRLKDVFIHQERTYPVYFNYAYSELDRVEIKLPPGLTPESVPQRQDMKLDYARYQTASVSNGKYLVSERVLGFNAIYVQLARYGELRDFMTKVHASDDQQAVMTLQTSANSQSSK